MPVSHLLAAGTLVAALAGLQSRSAEVPEGARLYISDRGQAWLKTHFDEVLRANGVDLSRRRISKTEFKVNQLAGARAERSSTRTNPLLLQRLASIVGACFRGLPAGGASDLHVSMLDYGYRLKFDHFTAEIERRGPAQYGLGRGVIVLLRADASEFRFDLPRLRAFNDSFGTFDLDGIEANLTEEGRHPVWMEIPVLIDTDAQGLNVRVLAVRTNFTQVSLQASFEKLLLPPITVTVGRRSYSFDRTAFEQEMRRLLPDLLPPLQGVVKSFFEEKGAEQIFQPLMDEAAGLATVQLTLPLGTADQPEHLEIRMLPTQVEDDGRNFMLAFRASMTDPLASEAVPFLAQGAASAPTLRTAPAGGYDLALAIHPAVLNGIINRMFSHQILGKVDVGDSEPAELDAAPWLVLDQRDPRKVLLHLRLSVDAHQWLVQSRIPFEFDLRLRIAVNPRNQVELIPEEILLGSVVVDTRRTRTFLGLFKDRVRSGVMDRLESANGRLRTSPAVVRSIASLDSLLGVPLHLVDAFADNGNVVLYSEWEAPFANRGLGRRTSHSEVEYAPQRMLSRARTAARGHVDQRNPDR